MPEVMEAPETKALSLRDLHDELEAWSDTLAGLEDDDVDMALVRAKLEHIQRMHENKIDQRVWLIHFAEQMQAEYGKAELRFKSRKRAWGRLEDKLRRSSCDLMVTHKLERLEGRNSRISLSSSAERPLVDDVSKLPSEYLEWVPPQIIDGHYKPNLAAIERDLKSKKEVPGARLLPGTPFVRIT